jgi:glycosyltransferase involved in cell wall biosynthesis
LKPKILVILPALNEGKIIGAIVREIRAELVGCDVLVIDGFSVDDTVEQSIASGAHVIQVAKVFGIATAVEAGILYAYRGDYDYLVRIDADGQHPPSEIQGLLKSVVEGKADFVIGSRFLGNADYSPNLLRSLSIGMICFLLRVFHNVKVSDCTSGCQIYNREVIKFFARDTNFEYSEVRAIWMAHKAGFRILEQFINMTPRTTGVSSFSPMIALLYMFKNMVDIVLSMPILVKRDRRS